MPNPNISNNYQDAFLSNIAYESQVVENGVTIPLKEGNTIHDDFGKSYTVFAVPDANTSDYQAYAFKDEESGKITIAHRGTESFKDAKADINIGLGILPGQVDDAVKFQNQVLAKAKSQSSDPDSIKLSSINQTGHSLGGGIAELLAVMNDGTATAFNAPKVSHLLDNLKEKYPTDFLSDLNNLDSFKTKITEIIEKDDGVNGVPLQGGHLGNIVTVDSGGFDPILLKTLSAAGPLGYLAGRTYDSHSMSYLLALSKFQKDQDEVAFKNAIDAINNTPVNYNFPDDQGLQITINYQGNIDPLAQIGNSLFLGDESISGNAVCLADSKSPSEGENRWKLTTSTYGKEYVLTRVDDNDKPSVTGTKLIIAPVDQGVDSKGNKITTTQNCVVINNFPFSQSIKAAEEAAKNNGVSTTVAPFGIKLGYLSEHSKFIVNEPSIEINNYSAVLLNDKKDNTVSTIYDNLSCDGAVLYKWAGQGADYEAMVLDKNGLKVKDKDAIALIPPSNSLLREIRPLTDDGRWYVCYSNYAEADFDHSENGRGSGVLMKIFDNKGNVVKDMFPLVDTTVIPGEYRNIGSINSFPDGNFVVRWNKLPDNKYFAQGFNKNGEALTAVVESTFNKPVDATNDLCIYGQYGGSISWNGFNDISSDGYKANQIPKVYNQNGQEISTISSMGLNSVDQCRVEDFSKLPTIKLINPKVADKNTPVISGIDGDNNVYGIGENNIVASIPKFSKGDDYIDLSPLTMDFDVRNNLPANDNNTSHSLQQISV